MTDIHSLSIKADTTDLERGDKALDDFANSADRADKEVSQLEKTIETANKDLKQTGAAGKIAASGVSSAGASAGKATPRFKAMKGATQQLSFQLQDVAVQAQMGTSAFTILGQQGPQIASIFGTGGAVVGALIALGAIVGGTLVTALGAGEDALAGFSQAMKDAQEDTENLTKAQAAFVKLELTKGIKATESEIRSLSHELARLEEFSVYNSDKTIKARAQLDFLNETLAEQKKQLEGINDVLGQGSGATDSTSDIEFEKALRRKKIKEDEKNDEAELAVLRSAAWAKHSQILDQQAAKEEQLRQLRVNGFIMHQKVMTANAEAETKKREALEERAAEKAIEMERMKQETMGDLASAFTTFMEAEDKKLFEIGKLGSASMAVINAYEAITKAWAQGGVFGAFSAAAVGTAAFLNVKKILGTKYGDSTTSAPPPSISNQNNSNVDNSQRNVTVNVTGQANGFDLGQQIEEYFNSDNVAFGQGSAQWEALQNA
jgi:hypothetical protein